MSINEDQVNDAQQAWCDGLVEMGKVHKDGENVRDVAVRLISELYDYATVDEEALIKALQEGWISHAALDVLETEPPSHNNPMLSMENVTLTAHVASASARFD